MWGNTLLIYNFNFLNISYYAVPKNFFLFFTKKSPCTFRKLSDFNKEYMCFSIQQTFFYIFGSLIMTLFQKKLISFQNTYRCVYLCHSNGLFFMKRIFQRNIQIAIERSNVRRIGCVGKNVSIKCKNFSH